MAFLASTGGQTDAPPVSASTNPPAEAEADGLPTPRRAFATAALMAAIVLVVLDGAIANVALPTLARALEVPPAMSVLVVMSYQVALVMAVLPGAALGESLGYRRVFTTGVLLFTVASAGCALSPSLPWLIACRFAQGLGGAAVMSTNLALLRFTFPQRLLGGAIGLNAMTVALSGAAGPTIGAAILSVASWPWLFAVNLPLGAVVLLATRALPRSDATGRRIDAVSVLLNAGFLAPLVIGVDLLPARPGAGTALIATAACCLIALARREMGREAPLIPLDLLRDGAFRVSVVASVCCFAGQTASYVALPFYLQHGLGLDTFTTGLCMTPWPLTVALAAPISGRLSNRISTAWLCAAGGGCLGLGLLLAAAWPLHGHVAPLVACTILCGLGFGFFQTPNNRAMLLSAPRAVAPRAACRRPRDSPGRPWAPRSCRCCSRSHRSARRRVSGWRSPPRWRWPPDWSARCGARRGQGSAASAGRGGPPSRARPGSASAGGRRSARRAPPRRNRDRRGGTTHTARRRSRALPAGA
jgi:DHA2 family multidrug resistance protein-like MFS transporter